MDQLMLKPAEAARLLGIGRSLFYQLVKANEIPHCRVSKSIRVPAQALKDWAARKAAENNAGNAAPALSGRRSR